MEFYSLTHKFVSGLSLRIGLVVRDDIVKTVNVSFDPERSEDSTAPREWLAYSPESLIKQYGSPTKVEVFGTQSHEPGAALNISYALILYFDTVDLIIQYRSAYDYVKMDPATGSVKICPLTDQFQLVRVWPGKDPDNPPFPAFTLEEGSSLTLKEFSEMMLGDVNQACFDIRNGIFD
jgi:hypothetical protein